MAERKVQCSVCGGHGISNGSTCYGCNGHGFIIEEYDDSSSRYTTSSSGRSSGPSVGDRFLAAQKQAFASYKNNDIDTALKLCNDALEMYKPYMSKNDYYAKFVAATYNLRGVCNEAKGNIEQAYKDFSVAAYDWGNNEAYANYKNLEKTIEEKREKEKASKANNENFTAGDQLLDEGNYNRAITQYTKTIRAGGSNKAVALMNRAACYAKKGDKEQAIDDYTDAINSGLTESDLATAKAELAKLK